MSVVDDAIKSAAAGLDFAKSADRLRGGYIRRRADLLHHDNPSWAANRIATQLTSELAAVRDYMTKKAPLLKNADDREPRHIFMKVGAALITLSIDNGAFGQRMFD